LKESINLNDSEADLNQ